MAICVASYRYVLPVTAKEDYGKAVSAVNIATKEGLPALQC